MSSFPFPFHGDRPSDWNSTGLEHPYEVNFAREPGVEERRRIAEHFERALAAGAAAASPRPWEWSGSIARLWLAPRDQGDDREMLWAAGSYFRALHAVAPLRQVLFLGLVEGGTSAWDEWSARQPMLSGPFSSSVRGASADMPTPIVDTAFEAARAAGRRSSPVPAQGVALEPVDRDIRHLVGLAFPKGAEAIFHLEGQAPPRIPSDGDQIVTVTPRMLAVARQKSRAVGLVYDGDGTRRSVGGLPETFAWPLVHSDGQRGFVRARNDVYAIDFGAGTATVLFTAQEALGRMTLAGDHIIATVPGGLGVYSVSEPTGLVSKLDAPECIGLYATDDDIVWLERRGATDLYRLDAGRLTKIGSVDTELRPSPMRLDGELLAHDATRGTVRITGL